MKGIHCSANRFAVIAPCDIDSEEENTSNPEPETPRMPTKTHFPEQILIRSSHLSQSTEINVHLHHPQADITRQVQCLIDSGATGEFIDAKYVKQWDIPMITLDRPIPVYNVDGTSNQAGCITEQVQFRMSFGTHVEPIRLFVTDLGKDMVILGH